MKGQVPMFTIMLAVVVIILAIAFAPAINEFTTTARNDTTETTIGMNCSNTTISNFDKATCVVIDLYLPYFMWGLLAIAGAIAVSKVLIGANA